MGKLYKVEGTSLGQFAISAKESELADDPNENTNGIVALEVKAYGDDPSTTLIRVWAVSSEIAVDTYEKAHKLDMVEIFSL